MTHEIQPFSDAPPSIDWWVTSVCNLSCNFCYGPIPEGFEKKIVLDKILHKICQSKTKIVTLCGGEPLVIKELDDIVGVLSSYGKKIVLNTNGELLTSNRLQSLRIGELIKTVGISLDGHDQVSHAIMRGKNASFSKAHETIIELKKKSNVYLKIATVISKKNIEKIDKIAEIVANIKPDVWRLYQYSARGQAFKSINEHHIDTTEFNNKVTFVKKIYPSINISSSDSEGTSGCFIISHKGDVLRPSGNQYITIGSCFENDIDEIWKHLWNSKEIVINNKKWTLKNY